MSHRLPPVVTRQHGNSYNIFILVLTILSLAIMGLLLLPLSEPTLETLRVYDNVICIVFLMDFVYNVTGANPRRAYLVGQRGWIDLLGSIPSLGLFPAIGLLRLFRLFRLARIGRLLRGQKKKELIEDVLHNRGQYATFITLLLILLTLTISSIMVLQFESRSPDANITTGGDALWWSVVTITTVGYGDHYPVTALGRLTGVGVMFVGIGVIGALASILASLLVSGGSGDAAQAAEAAGGDPGEAAQPGVPTDAPGVPTDAPPEVAVVSTSGPPSPGPTAPAPPPVPAVRAPDIDDELALVRAELAATRAEMAQLRRAIGSADGMPPGSGAPAGTGDARA